MGGVIGVVHYQSLKIIVRSVRVVDDGKEEQRSEDSSFEIITQAAMSWPDRPFVAGLICYF